LLAAEMSPDGKGEVWMHTDRIDQAVACGFDRVQAQRLAFVRWSRLEGYAQFMEEITSDDYQVVKAGPGFAECDRKEAQAA
jgi:hypothetical protein